MAELAAGVGVSTAGDSLTAAGVAVSTVAVGLSAGGVMGTQAASSTQANPRASRLPSWIMEYLLSSDSTPLILLYESDSIIRD
jgi:hypothetical protein